MELIEFIKENRWDYENNKKVDTFFDFEQDYINHIHNNQYSLTVKSRQMYISSLTILYCAWNIIYNKNINIYFISPNLAMSRNKIKKLSQILNSLRVSNIKNNTNEIILENGNSFKILSSLDSFCSQNFSNSIIILDEAAFKKDLEDILNKGIRGFENIKLIIYSTPNKELNYFNELASKSNSFIKLNLPYYLNPNYGIKWVDFMKENIGKESFKIECECSLEQIKKPNPKSNLIQFRVDHDLYNKIGLKLIKSDQSISNYLRGLILKDINQ